MIETIIKTGISFIVTACLGYLIGQVKNYKKKLQLREVFFRRRGTLKKEVLVAS